MKIDGGYRQACPDCGSLDLDVSTVVGAASCPLCGWEGRVNETTGLLTTETVYDIERVGEIAIRILAKHAAGPLIQLWEHFGLLPKPKEIDRTVTGKRRQRYLAHNGIVQEVRDEVLRATLAGALEEAFKAAAECRTKHPTLFIEEVEAQIIGESKSETPAEGEE
jgi:hypothetical protein